MTRPLPLSADAAVSAGYRGPAATSRWRPPPRGGRAGESTICSRRERAMSSELLLDAAGRRRSPAAMPGHNAGQAPRNKGRVYPADPPTVDEIVAVMRQTPPDRAWAQGPGADRGAMARRTADAGSAVADRVRSRPAPRVDPDSPRQREPSAGSRDGRLGVVRSSRAMARRPCRAAGRRAVLRDRRADARPAVVSDRRTRRAAPVRARGWRSAQVRASSLCRRWRYADQSAHGV